MNKREQLEALVAKLQKAADDVDAKRARGEEPSGDELGAIVTMSKEARSLKNAILADAKAEKEAKDSEGALEDAKQFLADLGINPDARSGDNPRSAAPGAKAPTLAEQFLGSGQFKSLMSKFKDGRIPDRAGLSMDPVAVKSLLRPTVKDLITIGDANSGGALVVPQQSNIVDLLGARPLAMRDVITVGQTDSDSIDFVRELTRTNNAAPVPEATSSDVIDGTTVTTAAGGLKPESSITFERENEAVKTIAHWVPITRKALSNRGQLRTIIETFLRDGLEEELEDQMLVGDGVGENFTGLANTADIQVHAVGGDTLLDAYRKAKTKVRIGGRSIPTAYVMNPADWEQVDLLRNGNGDYYNGGPFRAGAQTLWGLPVVESEGTPAGTAYVADFRKVVLWDREQASITTSDSHADFFVRNLLAILAEMRAAYTVIRPSAVVQITGV